MKEVRPATADEMVLAFLQAEINSPTIRGTLVISSLTRIRADRGQLIDRGDPKNEQQNTYRRDVLGDARGYGRGKYLFRGFPSDTGWQLVTVTPAEVERFMYVIDSREITGQDPCGTGLRATRMVADGVKNLDPLLTFDPPGTDIQNRQSAHESAA